MACDAVALIRRQLVLEPAEQERFVRPFARDLVNPVGRTSMAGPAFGA